MTNLVDISITRKAKSPAPFYIKTNYNSKKLESSRARDIDTIIIIIYYMGFVNRFLKISLFFQNFFTLFSEYAENGEKDAEKMRFLFPLRGIDKAYFM